MSLQLTRDIWARDKRFGNHHQRSHSQSYESESCHPGKFYEVGRERKRGGAKERNLRNTDMYGVRRRELKKEIKMMQVFSYLVSVSQSSLIPLPSSASNWLLIPANL